MKRPVIMMGGDRSRVLPRTVYYQCIWIMRDRERLLDLVSFFEENGGDFETVILSDRSVAPIRREVIDSAYRKLEAIERALEAVPEEYREGIVIHCAHSEKFPDVASENTWKKWNKVFMLRLAAELDLI